MQIEMIFAKSPEYENYRFIIIVYIVRCYGGRADATDAYPDVSRSQMPDVNRRKSIRPNPNG